MLEYQAFQRFLTANPAQKRAETAMAPSRAHKRWLVNEIYQITACSTAVQAASALQKLKEQGCIAAIVKGENLERMDQIRKAVKELLVKRGVETYG